MPEDESTRPKHVAYVDETNKPLLWLTAVGTKSLCLVQALRPHNPHPYNVVYHF